jgi:TPR repeat protein
MTNERARSEAASGAALMKDATLALTGRRRNRSKGIELLQAAAAMGNHEAEAELGAWYLDGYRTSSGRVVLPRSPKRAVRWLERAANAGVSFAQVHLGHCYSDGVGVPKSERRAARWYEKAIRNGDVAGAWGMCGNCFRRGDTEGQRHWLAIAAKLGDPDALEQLTRSRSRRSARPGSERA